MDSEGGRGEEERGRERNFTFFLRSMEIGSSVFVGARRKVNPHIASYAWIPKSWSFVKLHEVGNFPTLIIFSLKVIQWHRFSSGRDWPCDLVSRFWD